MALEGGMTVEFPDGREPVRLRFSVSTEDEATLRLFATATQELIESLRRAGGLPARIQLSFQQGEGLRFAAEEPTEDQRAIILHRLRPLVLTNEPASFDRVCGIVRRASNHEFLGIHLRRLRDIYSGGDLRDMVVISRGDMVINSDAAFQHWLNGFEYHRDADRAANVVGATPLLPLEAIRPIFMMLLSEKLKAITLLAYMVGKMLERPVAAANP